MEIERSRDVDAWIAEHVFSWPKQMTTPDYDGQNISEILVPPGGIPAGFELPRKGLIHRGYFAPQFTSDPNAALSFAHKAGLETVPVLAANNAVEICRLAMAKWKSR